MKKVLPVLGLVLVAAGAQAQSIDTTAAIGGVTAASTAVLAVLGAMITMAAAVFGLKKVLRLLGR